MPGQLVLSVIAGATTLGELRAAGDRRAFRAGGITRAGESDLFRIPPNGSIVLPDTPKHNGAILAEKIREMIEQTKFEFETNIIPVTISMGVTDLQKGDTVDAFIGRADGWPGRS